MLQCYAVFLFGGLGLGGWGLDDDLGLVFPVVVGFWTYGMGMSLGLSDFRRRSIGIRDLVVSGSFFKILGLRWPALSRKPPNGGLGVQIKSCDWF